MAISEATEDEAVGQSQRFCVIKPQVCVQKYEYFMYDSKGSSPGIVSVCFLSDGVEEKHGQCTEYYTFNVISDGEWLRLALAAMQLE